MKRKPEERFMGNLRKEWNAHPFGFTIISLLIAYGIYGLWSCFYLGEANVWLWVWYALWLTISIHYVRRLFLPKKDEPWAEVLLLVVLLAQSFVYFTIW